MKIEVGIRKNTIQRIISGARVAFDVRATEQVVPDPKNYKADERPLREWRWKLRQTSSDTEAAE